MCIFLPATSLTERVGTAERIRTCILPGFTAPALKIRPVSHVKLYFLPPVFFSGFSKLVSQQEGSDRFGYLLKNG